MTTTDTHIPPGGPPPNDAHTTSAAGNQTPRLATEVTTPVPLPPVVDPLLFVHATAHNDLEKQRIASESRLRILTLTEPDDDGVMRGFGLDDSQPDVARLRGITDALIRLEHDAELGLKRSLRRSPIWPWVKESNGLGQKQTARLLAAIADPYWHLAEDRPRTVSELWAYCGLHVLPVGQPPNDTRMTSAGGANASDPGHPRLAEGGGRSFSAGVAARRRRGVQSNWSSDAKVRAYLCATSCIKKLKPTCRIDQTVLHAEGCGCSPYRIAYDDRRSRTAQTHPEWTDGHSHADGLRIASKAILRDLWREAKRLHEEGTNA